MSQSINLSFLEKMTQRIEPLFPIWLKELNFFQFDSKNWTLKEKWPKKLKLLN